MNDQTDIKVPNWFWLIAGLAFLWNLLGMMQFVMQYFISDELLATMPEQTRALIQSPLVNIAFALAVTCGVLGCIGLLSTKEMGVSFVCHFVRGHPDTKRHRIADDRHTEVDGPFRVQHTGGGNPHCRIANLVQ